MKFFGRILSFAVTFALAAIVVVAIAGGAYLFRLSQELPDYAKLKTYEPPITTRVHAGDGTLIAEYARERRLFVPYASIPPTLISAFLSAEDKNFYEHPGIDYQGVIRAIFANIYNALHGRRLEGASTITQQVAKNFLLSNEVSLKRKIKEALLSFRIERAFTKEKILELYLNEIYLGNASYGVAAAALNYFGKSLNELSLGEVAYLAAVPKAPNNYHPVRNKAEATSRRDWVLDRMAENGYVTREAARAAKAEPLVGLERPMGAQLQEAKYFAEEVRREVYNLYGEQSLYDGGLSVRTSLDMKLQGIAIKALRDGLVRYDQRHGWRGPVATIALGDGWQKRLDEAWFPSDMAPWRKAVVLDPQADKAVIGFPDGKRGEVPLDTMLWARRYHSEKSLGPEVRNVRDVLTAGDVIYVEPVVQDGKATGAFALRQMPGVNGAIVAMDPHTGRVLALVGGASYDLSVFNRATQAMRQTGSAFKPFVYAAALDNGYTPSSIVLDAPFVMEQGVGLELWKPENYTEDYYGPSTLRLGVEKSRNAMTVRLASAIGMAPIVDYAKRFGIVDNMPPLLSMALGAGETTLLRLTTGYAVLVNGGKKVTPTLIDRIQDRHGKTVFRHDQRACDNCNAQFWANQEEPLLPTAGEDVLPATTAYQMVSILEGVIERGTGRVIKTVGKPLAGKTGTTNDERDAWFVGFSPDLVVGVFVGFDQPQPMGKGETGGNVAAPIFRDFMMAALADVDVAPFRVPAGIRLVRVNGRSGNPTSPDDPNAILEAFKSGTEPGASTAFDDTEHEGASPVVSGEAAGAAAGVASGTGGLY